MTRRNREKEVNQKSGLKWTREELIHVLVLYLKNREIKIHESNQLIIDLSRKLGRTTRSVEAQLLMFRNLDRFGNSGFRNMSKLNRLLWDEYINSTTL